MPLVNFESTLSKLDRKDIFRVDKAELSKHRTFIDLLHSIGIGKSKSDIRREVDKGGIYLNNLRLHP